jgi:thiamine biosynthesis lipoprotein
VTDPALRSFRALGTRAVVATADPDALPLARALLVVGLRAFDLACSRFRADSELAALNRAAGRPVEVGELLWDAISVAVRAAEETDGLVDPTVGRSLRLAGYDRPFARVSLRDGRLVRPEFERPAGWRELDLDAGRRAVRVPAGVELDLGATAKALAADALAGAAAAVTATGVLVSLGGDVAVAGEAPGAGWAIRLADDHAAPLDVPGPIVAVTRGGLATSGVAVRRWQTVAGELHHIVDPRTGRPADAVWRTATVAARSCVEANAASTAAVILGADAPAWLEARCLPARLVHADGAVVRVAGWPPEEPEAPRRAHDRPRAAPNPASNTLSLTPNGGAGGSAA